MKPKSCACSQDEVREIILDALADDIYHRPELLRPVPAELVDRIRSLVADVEVDLDQPLPPETEGAGTR